MAKQFVCKLADIAPGHSRTFVVFGQKIFIVNAAGGLKAYVNFCPHMGGSLHYDGRNIKCNWHGAMFDLETGAAKTAPAMEGQKLEPMEVSVEGDSIYFDDSKGAKSAWADDF